MTSGPEVSSDSEVTSDAEVLYNSLIDSVKCVYKFNAFHSNSNTTHSGICNTSLYKMKHPIQLAL